MDVSATGQAVAAGVTHATVDTVVGVVAAPSPQSNAPATQPTASSETQTTPAPVPGSTPAVAHDTIANTVAKLFAPAAPVDPVRLNVSYRVERDPDVIVTVFSNPQTGEEVAQFPPEILINLAQFFDQSRGVTLDRSA